MTIWIPVTEQMPDDDESVLLACADGEVQVGFRDCGRWLYLDAYPIGPQVTHWMALPAHPDDPGVTTSSR